MYFMFSFFNVDEFGFLGMTKVRPRRTFTEKEWEKNHKVLETDQWKIVKILGMRMQL